MAWWCLDRCLGWIFYGVVVAGHGGNVRVKTLSRILQIALLLLLVLVYYLQAAKWLSFRYVRILGRGEVVAEKNVESLIRGWSRLHFLTRTDRIARYIHASPWVDRVSVYKSFDRGLVIDLDYKVPVMRSVSGRYLIDRHGHLILSMVTNDLLRLPTFTGDKQSVGRAYQLWSRLDRWQGRLMSVSHDVFSGWELLFDNKVTVRLGARNLSQRLDLFLKVAKHWRLFESSEAQVFDMRYNNSFSHKKIKRIVS